MEAIINSYAPVGKEATFAVILTDKYGNQHKRVVPLKLKSKYQAELVAAKYALQAIVHKDVSVVLKTSVSQIPQIFAKDKDGNWVKRKKSNDLVDELRDLASKFEQFDCVKDVDSELMLQVKELSRAAHRI